MRRLTLAVTVILLSLATGCYEEHAQEPAAAPAPAVSEDDQPPRGAGDTARPSHGAAKRAADDTVDKLQERQQEIEDAIDDQP